MLRIVFAVLFAVSLAAQPQRIVLDPPGPTSATQIVADLYVSCDPLSHTLERLGNVIKIHVTPGPIESLCDPPIAVRYPVVLGTLPVGQYRIDVMVGERDSVDSKTFIVRNAAEGPFNVHPFAIPTHLDGLTVRLDAGDLVVSKVFVDGVQVGLTINGAYHFRAPAHAPGLVDVRIETNTGATHTLAGALYYYDASVPPDTSVFERILFPVLFHSAGAHGSQWVSEAAMANAAHWPIKAYNSVSPFECPDCGVGQHFQPESYIAFTGAGYPKGVALLVPRAEAENLAFSLRVRDTSREAEGYGTQIPVVREKDMFRNTDLTLLDVPVDPLYRVKVRIYAFDTGDHDAEVTVHRDSAPNTVAARHFVPMRRAPCTGARCHGAPWYGELDLPSAAADDRVNVYITLGSPQSPAWAFASITNNETQQVTIVTADGSGGRP
ncbi:MAG TPA: hypothetical protein VF432_11920 [Thermoanaerobaculia bacterium]